MPLRRHLSLPLAVAALLATAAPAAASCPGADMEPGAMAPDAARAAVVCLTNVERVAAGLPALNAEARLERTASAYAVRIVTERFFAHVGPDGSTLRDRLVAYTDWTRIGENLAWGENELGTPRGTVAAWMRSPSHRANILQRDFTEVGIGLADGSPVGSSMPAATWVAHYGTRELPAGMERSAPAEESEAAPPRAARRPVQPKRCGRGTVRRVRSEGGRRVTRCVKVKRKRR